MDEIVNYSDDPLQTYLRELRRIPALDEIEGCLCLQHVRANDPEAEAARTRLLEAHLPLVIPIAERYRTDQAHILDLIERGNSGLMQAVRSVETDDLNLFAVQAIRCIEQAITETVAES